MSNLPKLDQLSAMKWKDRKDVIYKLSAEDANAYLDQIEALRSEGGLSKEVN